MNRQQLEKLDYEMANSYSRYYNFDFDIEDIINELQDDVYKMLIKRKIVTDVILKPLIERYITYYSVDQFEDELWKAAIEVLDDNCLSKTENNHIEIWRV